MKISKNSQRLRIEKNGLDGLSAESVVVFILLVIFILLCILPLLWLSRSNVDGRVALSLFVAILLVFGLAFYAFLGSRICIEVNANVLSIKYVPISFGNNKKLPSEKLKLTYYEASRFCIPHINPEVSLNPFRLTHEDYAIAAYKIYVATNKLEPIELLSLDSKEDASLIVKEINQFLQLEDNLVKIDRVGSSNG